MEGVAGGEDAAVLAAFLRQYYDAAISFPEEVLVPFMPDDAGVLREWLSELRGKRVALEAPKIGDKRRLVEMVTANAVEAADERRQKWLTDEQKTAAALGELKAALNLPVLPLRIECYDISNIQGTSAVGSMVVFERGRPRTDAYRRFRIKTVEGADDFAMMAEMLRRRLKRAGQWAPQPGSPVGIGSPSGDPDAPTSAEAVGAPLVGAQRPESRDEDGSPPGREAAAFGQDAEQSVQDAEHAAPTEWEQRPQLIIVDGGKGQLNAALGVLAELGIADQPIAGLAKQQEELFVPGRSESIMLPRDSQGLFLLQRIRDEAHRFAVTYHHNVRGKKAVVSDLDDVHGVGGRRKKALLQRFGSVPEIRKASVEEIAAVDGIGPKLAAAIKRQLGG
jgi:excinuclease ABC subunit C